MITYKEGFYAVNGTRHVVEVGLSLSVPDDAVVETFTDLSSLDAAYPDTQTNNLGGANGLPV